MICKVKHNGLWFLVSADDPKNATIKDKKIVFLSYAHDDNTYNKCNYGVNIRDRIIEIVLNSCNCAVWVDETGLVDNKGSIIGGAEWRNDIYKALDICSLMLLIVTPQIFDSTNFVPMEEIPRVRNRTGINGKPIPIFPIIADKVMSSHPDEVWTKLKKLTNQERQGIVLNNANKDSEEALLISNSVRNLLGNVRDDGVAFSINKILYLLTMKEFSLAIKESHKLRTLVSDRYESYWFECRAITEDFTSMNYEQCPKANELYIDAYKTSMLEKNRNDMQSIFDAYILNIIKYQESQRRSWYYGSAIKTLQCLSANAISANATVLESIYSKYFNRLFNELEECISYRNPDFLPYTRGEETIGMDKVIDEHGGQEKFELVRATYYLNTIYNPRLLEIISLEKSNAFLIVQKLYLERFCKIKRIYEVRAYLLKKFTDEYYQICEKHRELRRIDAVVNKTKRQEKQYSVLFFSIASLILVVIIFAYIKWVKGFSLDIIIVFTFFIFVPAVFCGGYLLYQHFYPDTDFSIPYLHNEYPFLKDIPAKVPQIAHNSWFY